MKKKKDDFDWVVIGWLAGAALVIVLISILVAGMRTGTTTEPRFKDTIKPEDKLETIKDEGKCYRFMHAPYKVRVEVDCE